MIGKVTRTPRSSAISKYLPSMDGAIFRKEIQPKARIGHK